MAKHEKLLQRILLGKSDSSVSFEDLRNLLIYLGFVERIRGGHHIFVKEGVMDLINLQRDKKMAKAYQVRQVRSVIVQYGLGGDK
jgi:hypothetical protein